MRPDRGPRAPSARWADSPGAMTWARPTVTWGFVLTVIAVATLLVVRFSRYPEWDEAVFLSQGGGFEGNDAPPLTLVASREVGTPMVLRLLQALNPSLPNVRAMWMALAFVLLVTAMVQLGRVLDFPAIAGLAVVSMYWLSFSFWSSFFSVFIATACMLLATGIYLSMRPGSPHLVARGVALGVVVAACLWFRQVEGALFATVLAGHSLVVTPRAFWSQRWRGVASATAALVVAFVVPWSVDSVRRFGSVAERLSSARGQSFERGLDSQLVEYARTLTGLSHTYDAGASPPTWAVVLLGVFLVAGLVGSVVCAVRVLRSTRGPAREDGVRVGGLTLLWLVGGSQLAFFIFFIGVVMDRYMVSGALFVLVAVVATVWRPLVTRVHGPTGRPGRTPVVAMIVLFSLWVVANSVIAGTHEQARYEGSAIIRTTATTIRALAGSEACHGVSRTGTPQLQFGSGCNVQSAGSVDAAIATAARQRERKGGLRFILWPARTADQVDGLLGPRQQSLRLEAPGDRRTLVLLYTPPDPSD